MRKQLLVLAGLAVTGVALAAAPPEGPKPDGPRGDRRPRLERKSMKEALGLTDAQLVELKKLRSDGQKKRIKSEADMKVARLELHDLLVAQTVDEKAVRAKAKQMADLQAAAANDRVESMLALRKVVNADQAEKIMKKMMHHGRQGGPGRAGLGRRMGPRGGPGGAGMHRGPQMSEGGDADDMDAAGPGQEG